MGIMFGKYETYKVVYYPKHMSGGAMGVALVEATSRENAMYAFYEQYAGQYSTVQSCTKLLG